jgi:hypothetical protein
MSLPTRRPTSLMTPRQQLLIREVAWLWNGKENGAGILFFLLIIKVVFTHLRE